MTQRKKEVVTTGLEPATLGLLDQCSTNWANRPLYVVKTNDWDEIRTRASKETSALNWRLRPLGHPIYVVWVDVEKKQNNKQHLFVGEKESTLGGARTHDHKIKSLALYHLSYEGKLVMTNLVLLTLG